MATFLDNLVIARDNLSAEMAAETARRLALVQAGNAPPVDYSLDGESFSFTGWLSAMAAKILELNDAIIAMSAGDEKILHGWN